MRRVLYSGIFERNDGVGSVWGTEEPTINLSSSIFQKIDYVFLPNRYMEFHFKVRELHFGGKWESLLIIFSKLTILSEEHALRINYIKR